jgi:hypothetical protein
MSPLESTAETHQSTCAFYVTSSEQHMMKDSVQSTNFQVNFEINCVANKSLNANGERHPCTPQPRQILTFYKDPLYFSSKFHVLI